jgi:hypothetical protein
VSEALVWDDAVLLIMVAALVLAVSAARLARSMRRRRHLRLPRDRLR